MDSEPLTNTQAKARIPGPEAYGTKGQIANQLAMGQKDETTHELILCIRSYNLNTSKARESVTGNELINTLPLGNTSRSLCIQSPSHIIQHLQRIKSCSSFSTFEEFKLLLLRGSLLSQSKNHADVVVRSLIVSTPFSE
ncbi:hypothetical protein CEXT_458771 [Caerostris extrusa]|uniref:Uncharacterized protein n=1 Tax=Caerostris extrusa TaxID=172846 RepID=A0AAV4V3X8_CAEEX|nr:hypothetical protein CEXT_458771 [Caerostris extrusa]